MGDSLSYLDNLLNLLEQFPLVSVSNARNDSSVGDSRRFPFTKNFGKFVLGISVWEERVPRKFHSREPREAWGPFLESLGKFSGP